MTWVEQAQLAGQMRRTARALSHDHQVAADHVADAADQLELGNLDGTRRHLDAAAGLLAPAS